jgi:hypothetical protein
MAGELVRVDPGPDGDPIEIVPVRGERRGAYVLAGLSNLRGVLPYRWVTREEWAGLRRWLRLRRHGA